MAHEETPLPDFEDILATIVIATNKNLNHKAPGYIMEKLGQFVRLSPGRSPRCLLDLEGQKRYDKYMEQWAAYLSKEPQPVEAP